MRKIVHQFLPKNLEAIEKDTKQSGFTMPSDRKTGSLLKTLASSKPGGRFLELGTGTGLSTAWILSGMDPAATLHSADNDETVLQIAQNHLGDDSRVTFFCNDGEKVIQKSEPESYDFIFADAWPGKYHLLDETLSLLKIGGFYVIDDMSPQPNWPENHPAKVDQLLEILDQKENLSVCRLEWSTGVVICTRMI